MEVYFGRQPIFDRNMKTYGYELFYRRSKNNFYEGSSYSQATAELITTTFLSMAVDTVTGGKRAFINFSDELLIKEVPLLLPRDLVVVELIEEVEPTTPVIQACAKLVAQGYLLALDDYVHSPERQPLVDLAAIIKVELGSLKVPAQREFFLRNVGNKRFVAEKIDSRADCDVALHLGFDYVQGHFFSKPLVITGRTVKHLNANLLRMIDELSRGEPDYTVLASIIQGDAGLVYKILRLVNSAAFRGMQKIESLEQALVRLGLSELTKWVYLLLLMEVHSERHHELIKSSLTRARLMESLTKQHGVGSGFNYFLAGLFSSFDVVLDRSMSEIVLDVALPEDVRAALLGKRNRIRQDLDHISHYERGEWATLQSEGFFDKFPMESFMPLYLEAIAWADSLYS